MRGQGELTHTPCQRRRSGPECTCRANNPTGRDLQRQERQASAAENGASPRQPGAAVSREVAQ